MTSTTHHVPDVHSSVRPMDVEAIRVLLLEPVEAESILTQLVPPRHFAEARFENYVPDTNYPSQAEAVRRIIDFTNERASLLTSAPSLIRSITKLLRQEQTEGRGLYLDGGFGIGKTHLLASAFHAFKGSRTSDRAAYLSFQELMFLSGLLGLARTVERLAEFSMLIIDEFELDDPANTRISTNLLGQLFARGVRIITSSNTPPGALGQGKFSVEDFQREMGELTSRFDTLRIDGEDYRTTHRAQFAGASTWHLTKHAAEEADDASGVHPPSLHAIRIHFDQLLNILASAHPMRVRQTVAHLPGLHITDLTTIEHPHAALRFVYFIDKSYDADIPLTVTSDISPQEIFHASYFNGGDTKKYRRAISRIVEMTNYRA